MDSFLGQLKPEEDAASTDAHYLSSTEAKIVDLLLGLLNDLNRYLAKTSAYHGLQGEPRKEEKSMRYLNGKKLKALYRRLRYRSWIKSQLQQAGGADYLERLEVDIGAEPGHFRRELEEKLITEKKSEGSKGATGLNLRLPPLSSSPGKV